MIEFDYIIVTLYSMNYELFKSYVFLVYVKQFIYFQFFFLLFFAWLIFGYPKTDQIPTKNRNKIPKSTANFWGVFGFHNSNFGYITKLPKLPKNRKPAQCSGLIFSLNLCLLKYVKILKTMFICVFLKTTST